MQGERIILLALLLCAAAGCRVLPRAGADPVSSADAIPSEADEQSPRSGLASLRPTAVRSTVQEALGRAPDETAARQFYQEADALFQKASAAQDDERADLFVEAAGKYAEAAEKWPDSMLQEDALLMKAESYFFADRYNDSRRAFEELVAEYPNTRHIDRVAARRFDIAQYWLAVHRDNPRFFLTPNWGNEKLPHNDTFGNAVRVFDKIRLDDPTGRLADDAAMAAGSAYFAAGEYRHAERFLTDLRQTYPESQHQFEAALLGVKSKIKLYQGPDYASAPLEEAQQLIELMFEQFPNQAREHREYLENAYKDVRLKLALRDWQTAKFYDRRGQYGGARHYYRKLIREFSDTSLAADAQSRLEEIQDEPDHPPQRMQWLVDAMPETKHQGKPLLSRQPFGWLRR